MNEFMNSNVTHKVASIQAACFALVLWEVSKDIDHCNSFGRFAWVLAQCAMMNEI